MQRHLLPSPLKLKQHYNSLKRFRSKAPKAALAAKALKLASYEAEFLFSSFSATTQ
jgi:hypothetical protein